MDRLPLDAERLLEKLRQLDDPTTEERQRADAGVRRMLAAHRVRNPPRLPAPVVRPSLQFGSAPAWSIGTRKLLWGSASLAVLLALGFWGVSAWRESARSAGAYASQERTSAPTAPAPATGSQPESPLAVSPQNISRSDGAVSTSSDTPWVKPADGARSAAAAIASRAVAGTGRPS